MSSLEPNRKEDQLEQATIEMRETSAPLGPPEDLISATVDAIRLEPEPKVVRFRERREMMFRIARFSGLAASLAVLVGLGVTLLGTSSIALADVAKAIENARFLRCKQVEINRDTEQTPELEQVTQRRTLYFDLKNRRSRTETHYGLPEGPFVTVQDDKLGKRIMLNPQAKTALLTVGKTNEQLEPVRHPFEAALKAKEATISHGKLDGIEYVFVQLVDTNNNVPGTTTMWLDRHTLLPVRVEYALPDLKLWYTMTDFEWKDQFSDPDGLFSVEAPEGYEVTRSEQP